jgi:hypothetical protein
VAGQSDAWYGDKSQSTLWEENKPAANRLHPTMKPVELIERALLNSSKAGDLVADFFGGSCLCARWQRVSAKQKLVEPSLAGSLQYASAPRARFNGHRTRDTVVGVIVVGLNVPLEAALHQLRVIGNGIEREQVAEESEEVVHA